MLLKNILVVIGLAGLIGWGVYDYASSSTKTEEVTEQEQVSDEQESNNYIETGLQEGEKAPDFELQTLAGEQMKLSDMKGKTVILNFWATWCPPCKAEMPHMQDFYTEQEGKNIEILAVNLTTAEKDQNNIGTFVKDYGLTFPILLDSNGEVGQTYQAFSIPTSYIVDSSGIIQKKIIGPMNKEMMYELVKSVK